MAVKVLLDTTFLLPSFGVDVGEEVEACLKLLAEGRFEVYYSRYSLLEALFILSREVRRGRLQPWEASEMAEEGALAVVYGLRAADEPPAVLGEAIRIYSLGHRDIFDDLLYATALVNELRLLTLDEELRSFVRRSGLRDVTMTPGELGAV